MEVFTRRATVLPFLLLQSGVEERPPSGSDYLLGVNGRVAGSKHEGPGFYPSQLYQRVAVGHRVC